MTYRRPVKAAPVSISDQTQKSLEKVGLTSYEIKSFVALIKSAETTASDLSKQSGVPYSKIYEVLISFDEKGLIGDAHNCTSYVLTHNTYKLLSYSNGVKYESH